MTSKFGWLQAYATRNYSAPMSSEHPATMRIDNDADRIACLSRRTVAGSSPVAPSNLNSGPLSGNLPESTVDDRQPSLWAGQFDVAVSPGSSQIVGESKAILRMPGYVVFSHATISFQSIRLTIPYRADSACSALPFV
jgi:hypothetical protein